MSTARLLIKKAMQKAGVLTLGETPSAEEISDGLDALNDMLESWSNDSLLCYALVKESFTLTGATEYTIGAGQTLNTQRPNAIIAASIRSAGEDYPLRIIPQTHYEQYVANKGLPGRPRVICYDNNFPVARIYLAPAPDSTYSLRLLSEKVLTTLTLDDVVTLPPGWKRALTYNLAEEIKPEYGDTPISPDVGRIARTSKASIMRAVARNRSMDALPITAGTPGNIITGYWR